MNPLDQINQAKPVTLIQVLIYEIRSSWWAGMIPWPPLQDLVGQYFAWKAKRKFRRYTKTLMLEKKVLHYHTTGEWSEN